MCRREHTSVCACVFVCVRAWLSACVWFVWNKALVQRISKCEFKLWTILQGTESRVTTFHAEKCVMSHESLSRRATKSEPPTTVESGSKTPKSDHGSCENIYVNAWFVFWGVFPSSRLIGKASVLDWLRIPHPPPLTGERYWKMELKYPEGGHCQSVLRPREVFNVPIYFNLC